MLKVQEGEVGGEEETLPGSLQTQGCEKILSTPELTSYAVMIHPTIRTTVR